MKKIAFVLLLFTCGVRTLAQKDANRKNERIAEADAFWESMPSTQYYLIDDKGRKMNRSHFFESKGVDITNDASSLTDENWQKDKEHNEWHEMFTESQAKYLREWGIVFWQRFPNDKRRFEWLKETVVHAPSYKKKIGLHFMTGDADSLYDKAGYERWNKFYQRYRKEYLASNEITEEEKRGFEYVELSIMINDWKKFYAYEKFDYMSWIDRAIKYAGPKKAQSSIDYGVKSLIGSFNYVVLEDLDRFGITEKDADIIVTKLLKSGVSHYETVALGFQKPMTHLLKKTPLKFNTKSTDGRSVELSDYKGKLVLVDFWNLGCSGCILAMPKWREIYEKYNQYGFELISACFVGGEYNGKPIYKNEIGGIMAVHEKFSPGWPLVLLHKEPGKMNHRFYDIYQIVGNPVYMLFDENGKPLMTNGELGRNPEAVIRDHFIKSGKIK